MTLLQWVYVLSITSAVMTVVAMWYQVRYFKLVDALFDFLKPLSEEEKDDA